MLLSGNVQFVPSLPEWKLRALRQCELAAYTKIFIKFADDVRPFWDPTEWTLFVDSEKVVGDSDPSARTAPASLSTGDVEARSASDGTDQYSRLRNTSAAARRALSCGDQFTRGYYSVTIFCPNFLTI